MCNGKDVTKTVLPSVKKSNDTMLDGITNTAEMNFQLAKPKLSRNITSSVKLNLNKYWTKFGEIMTSPTKKYTNNKLKARSNKLSTNLFPQDLQINAVTIKFEDSFRAIEEMKQQRFELLQEDGCEIEDNLANEIREICGVSATSSYFECRCY